MKIDWVSTKLMEVGKVVSGGTPKTKNPEYWGDDHAWLTPADLSNYHKKYISKGRKSISSEGLKNSSAKLMPAGSVLFSSRAPIGYTVIAANEVSTNQGFKSLIPHNFLESEFLYYYLKSSKQLAEKSASGTTFKELSGKAFGELPISVAPLPEQRAIVAKIEQLFSELDNGIANLKKAQEQLKVFRQAVLKKAFEGELTKTWREQQNNLPTADELLAQINEEREKHYQTQLEEWKAEVKEWEKNGKKGKRPTKPKNIPKTESDGIELVLPREWNEIDLELVADAIDPQPSHRTPPVVEGGIPYVSIKDIDKFSGKIDFDNARKVSPQVLEEHIARYKLKKDDFVIGKIGTIGKPFFIPTERFFTLSANVVLVCPIEAISTGKYLYYLNISPLIEQQFKKGSKATTQAAFGIKKVRLLRIPICSLVEQHQIVQEIESRLSVCDKVEESIEENLQKAEALRQSILKRAFEGQLLTEAELETCRQQPDWELAEKLLERIKKSKS